MDIKKRSNLIDLVEFNFILCDSSNKKHTFVIQ